VSGEYPRFDPSEIRGHAEDDSVAELADALAVARGLEALATSDGIRPTDGFEDRVMGAIATQPIPRVAVRSRSAVRSGLVPAFLFTVRDAWVVATTTGRPMAMRVQALAFVLLAVIAFGSLTAAGAVTVGGLLGQHPSPPPSTEPDPAVTPTSSIGPTSTLGPTDSPTPAASAGPNATGSPSPAASPVQTARPARTPRPTATSGSGGSGTGGTGENPRPTETPEPTETAEPTATPDPTETPSPTDDHPDGGGGPGPG
jgi:hypothetical protein